MYIYIYILYIYIHIYIHIYIYNIYIYIYMYISGLSRRGMQSHAQASTHPQKVFRHVINCTHNFGYTFLLHNCLCFIKIYGSIKHA